jgi:hypothetical protein
MDSKSILRERQSRARICAAMMATQCPVMSARVFFLGVAVVFLIAVGSARAASPAPGIEIPAILSLTGSAAATGQEEAEA